MKEQGTIKKVEIKGGEVHFEYSSSSGRIHVFNKRERFYDSYVRKEELEQIIRFVNSLNEKSRVKDVINYLHEWKPLGINDCGKMILGIYKRGLVNRW